MKKVAKLFMCAVILLTMTGCMAMKTNTKAPILKDYAAPKLNIEQGVAIRNSSSQNGDIVIGKWIGWKVYADLYKYTETSIDVVKNILKEQGIKINDSAPKSLELSIYDAKSVQGAAVFKASTSLRVKTGDGQIKEYYGEKRHGNGYSTTSAMEKSIVICVKEMMNDRDIIAYLEK